MIDVIILYTYCIIDCKKRMQGWVLSCFLFFKRPSVYALACLSWHETWTVLMYKLFLAKNHVYMTDSCPCFSRTMLKLVAGPEVSLFTFGWHGRNMGFWLSFFFLLPILLVWNRFFMIWLTWLNLTDSWLSWFADSISWANNLSPFSS